MNAAHTPSANWRRVGISTLSNWKHHARGGGSGTSRVREGYATSLGRSGTKTTGSGTRNTTIRTGGAGGRLTTNSCSIPLHESADIEGRGHEARFGPLAAQHDEPPATRSGPFASQQELPPRLSHSPTHSHAGRAAIPRRNSLLSFATHNPQCALPDFTSFAAAIHCSSSNSTPEGGNTPFSIAHTNRCRSVWQQHFVQHS